MPISTAARITPKAEAAPPMSYFISSIAAGGFREMPPVSKVMPLPTMTIGALVLAAPLYCMMMNLAGSELPAVTDKNEPMPSFFILASVRTWVVSFLSVFASLRA